MTGVTYDISKKKKKKSKKKKKKSHSDWGGKWGAKPLTGGAFAPPCPPPPGAATGYAPCTCRPWPSPFNKRGAAGIGSPKKKGQIINEIAKI